MPLTLVGRTALVTGASRGLGATIAQRLATEGADLVLAARDENALDMVARELRSACARDGQRIVRCPTDVSNEHDVNALFECAVGQLGRLDVLVCNAGVYGPLGRAEDVPWTEWERAVEINLFGTVLCCRAAIPIMRGQGGGKIIILSGGGATKPLPRFSAYAASKAAVVRFAETLAEELLEARIDVNTVAPGSLNTRLLEQVIAAGPERVGSDFYERSLRQQAEGGTPLDVGADLVAFLASTESDGITGRLLAAVWDDWRQLPNIREQLANSDVFTLRRIVPEDRGLAMP
jgi:NAD(P)-dependent dehydrogenase (short-subunit alcohol dehydrogenase family)